MAAHLGPEVREAGGAIPWKKTIGLRSLAAHGYFILDMRDIWKTLAEDVPALKSEVSKLISQYRATAPHPRPTARET
ncbi:MAG: DUF86 domain-containing protein [Bifidobacteriaceae bacterium]|nr:DUF86 domain-containing protein [Bifidobacteriaceae bacterium]